MVKVEFPKGVSLSTDRKSIEDAITYAERKTSCEESSFITPPPLAGGAVRGMPMGEHYFVSKLKPPRPGMAMDAAPKRATSTSQITSTASMTKKSTLPAWSMPFINP